MENGIAHIFTASQANQDDGLNKPISTHAKLELMKSLILILVAAIIFHQSMAQQNTEQGKSLSQKQVSIVAISALTAKGDLSNLKQALHDGLSVGMSINEIKEELIHLSAYCGFPRSLNGIIAFNIVLDERKAKGITDVVGKAASKPSELDKFESGKKVLESLTGQHETYPKKSGYAAFVPAIDTLLKEHLFHDIFIRGVITHEERELTTIAALVSLGGVESQLQGHLGIGLHLGFTSEQLEKLMATVESKIGKSEVDAGRQVLARVLASRK
ncbi:carboxymuconolactone decarboxylase family protein [Dyadobacter sandarakinus]|uniref:Carboxymuconolactone decarboxylase family protein n=1 Tax=Dyadobacter sandarakinus TaxID=2747268 RepID=A0ABX7I221_9BACT|nr:carboxymuconolactone decarboxylase family protein [Dyadobacter sandarakinus]QRR00131.1 carboxymuconolactone decarboxylase family protein [Dyadobacter sandarakinus]